jgi:ribosomal RNA-processing protein 17
MRRAIQSDDDTGEANMVDELSEEPELHIEAQTGVVTHEDEYIDDDRCIAVTVDNVRVTRQGMISCEEPVAVRDSDTMSNNSGFEDHSMNNSNTENKQSLSHSKTAAARRNKKRNFRYENRAERKMSLLKEREKKKRKLSSRKRNA